jgi:hypothetical protein
VLELQGFECVTHLMWEKERPGNARGSGYWFTGEHEVVLVGTRGKVVPPATAHFRSRFSAPVGEHSEKPPNIHEIIEFHWPNTPKVEFNARRARPGWTVWGFDAPEIADDGEGSRAVDCPAPAADGVSSGSGIVDSNAGGPPSAVIETAVPPADRPGRNFLLPGTGGAHPLDIPEFLRRPIKQAEMDLTRRDRAPPEIVDGAMQTRLPLTEDELRLHGALTSVAAGQNVDGSIVRDLVGADFVRVTTDRLIVTEAGRTFLAQLVPAALSGGIAA